MLDPDRKQILASCLDVISGISDVEYQKRVWIRGEGTKVDDYDETACNFFQDGNGIIEHYKDFGLTIHQYEVLRNFRDAFDEFCSGPGLVYYLPAVFIDKPEWIKIVDMAKEVLRAFNYNGTV